MITSTVLSVLIYCPLLFRFSVSNDLKYDAERDLRDIGAKNIQVHSLNKVRDFDIMKPVNTWYCFHPCIIKV